MNTIPGKIFHIITEDNISLVKVKAGDIIFTSIVLDTPGTSPYLSNGNSVSVNFKETEVIIAKTWPLEISVQNRVQCVIKNITHGKILCQVDLVAGEFNIQSVITNNACQQLNLNAGDKVVALIKTNEVSLSYND